MSLSMYLADQFLVVWPTIVMLDLARYLIAAGVLTGVLRVFARPLAGRRIQRRLATSRDRQREIGVSLRPVLVLALVGCSVL
mgnify:CR=1 FL=1